MKGFQELTHLHPFYFSINYFINMLWHTFSSRAVQHFTASAAILSLQKTTLVNMSIKIQMHFNRKPVSPPINLLHPQNMPENCHTFMLAFPHAPCSSVWTGDYVHCHSLLFFYLFFPSPSNFINTSQDIVPLSDSWENRKAEICSRYYYI